MWTDPVAAGVGRQQRIHDLDHHRVGRPVRAGGERAGHVDDPQPQLVVALAADREEVDQHRLERVV